MAADAEWCGQCYAPLHGSAPAGAVADAPAPSPSVAVQVRDDGPADLSASRWRCPTCDAVNPLAADACAACGTPFSRLFESAATARRVSPAAAAGWSLLAPGLGHWFAGRRPDAVARLVLAAWVGGTVLVLAAGRAGRGGIGGMAALLALFGASAVGLWVESAVDAHRVASGLKPAVSARVLLWASIGLVVLSLVLATALTLPNLGSAAGGAVR